ncbi:TIGR01906 family membrane protein [Fructilactobacillus fructivorans]|uniref:TIGR01906 family membrane protein n=1 Tax=Fructilactobacillus fructivorans TaxID=1614 RepID=UPI0007053AFE
MNGMFYSLKDIGVFILILLFLITFSVFFIINASWLYYVTIAFMGLAVKFHVSNGLLMENFHRMTNFIQNPFTSELKLNQFPVSSNGMVHFENVRTLTLVNNLVLLITFISLLIIMFRFNYFKKMWKLQSLSEVTVLVIGVLALFCVLDFQDVFIYFHEVLFKNQDWIFNPKKDPIINVLPDQYFLMCFALFFLLVIVGLIIVAIIGKRELKKESF